MYGGQGDPCGRPGTLQTVAQAHERNPLSGVERSYAITWKN